MLKLRALRLTSNKAGSIVDHVVGSPPHRRHRARIIAAVLGTTVFGCGQSAPSPGVSGPRQDGFQYVDVSATHLPPSTLETMCLDAAFVDVDADGDLDIFIGNEFLPNGILINDGTGRFVDERDSRLPGRSGDSEDTAVADFDRDGDVDLIIVSEDDFTNEYYVNDGSGVFSDEPTGLPVEGRSNAVAAADLDGDGFVDLLIGNNGQNEVLFNNGAGRFVPFTTAVLPAVADATQDLEVGDLNGDGLVDLVFGNEDDNRVLVDRGDGTFEDVDLVLPPESEETRDVDLADVDQDGDLDILFTNVDLVAPSGAAQNRLLINDGRAAFTDETSLRLPADDDFTMDGDFVDIDGDQDLDLVTANYGDAANPRALAPYRVLINDGAGFFSERTADVFPAGSTGHGFDIESGDLNGDGRPDFYLCSGRSQDRLIVSR